MGKRLVLAPLMAALLAGGAFAQAAFSAGLGGAFSANFTNYQYTEDGKKAMPQPADWFDTNYTGGGAFAYFDAAYAMASLGITFYDVTPANKDAKKAMDIMKEKVSFTTFDIELFGKYPINLGAFTLFPLLGVDFKLALAYEQSIDGTKTTYEDMQKLSGKSGKVDRLTTIWGKIGVGADIPLGDKLYLRGIFLYGIGTNDEDQKETLEQGVGPLAEKALNGILNHGLDVKLAVGFKF